MRTCLFAAVGLSVAIVAHSPVARSAEILTTLANPEATYQVADKPYVVLNRADVEAVIVGNRPVDDSVLPGHRGGYSGVASLTHTHAAENLFVPLYAGLNFEHIHDGTLQDRAILFEPRNWPMELRVIDAHTVDLYQAATPHWALESCLRYRMLQDGVLEMTFECIPRKRSFAHGYVGLFWASYIHQPESLDIHFRGHDEGGSPEPRWVRGVTPAHGEQSTHIASDDDRRFDRDADFPLTLVFNRSKHRYDEPWYYGVSNGMALALMFRPQDEIRLSQSPSGGGQGNPAWDFQYMIPNYEVGRRYTMVMRAMYIPYESPEQVARATRSHRAALEKP